MDKAKNADEIIKRIWGKPPSSVVAGILKYEESHKIWFLHNYRGFVKLFEESYDYYAQMINSLNWAEKKDWGWSKNLPYIYLATSCFPLIKAYSVCLDGFYDESVALARCPYELLIKSMFCLYHPDDYGATYTIGQTPRGSRAFNLKNFLEHDMKVDWPVLYTISSGGSHGQLYFTRLLQQIKNEGKHGLIGLQLKINKDMAEVAINYLTFLMWAHLKLLTTIFDTYSTDPETNKTVVEEAKDFTVALEDILTKLPNDYKRITKEFNEIVLPKLVLSLNNEQATTFSV